MSLDSVRKELDIYDNLIKNMINFRMSIIPIVADIKIKNELPLFQGKREDEIYKNIKTFANENGIEYDLLKDIYKLIIQHALKTEATIVKDESTSAINNIDNLKMEDVEQDFQKLDKIIENEIPEIISKISEKCDKNNINLNQMATLYYNNKINKKS